MPPAPHETLVVEAADFSVFSGGKTLLEKITLGIPRGQITAIIGPTNSGKSLFLRCINRLCELDRNITTTGTLRVFGHDIHAPGTDVATLRRKVGMVFSKPSLPVAGIFENVALGPRLVGMHDKNTLARIVEGALREVGLWDQVGQRLAEPAAALSPEHQQRLCIARALAAEPVLLLFDEPTAHMDFPSAGHIEDLICRLAKHVPVILAAQTPQQASHIADMTAFILDGRLIEYGTTVQVLTNPQQAQTEAYVTGRLG